MIAREELNVDTSSLEPDLKEEVQKNDAQHQHDEYEIDNTASEVEDMKKENEEEAMSGEEIANETINSPPVYQDVTPPPTQRYFTPLLNTNNTTKEGKIEEDNGEGEKCDDENDEEHGEKNEEHK